MSIDPREEIIRSGKADFVSMCRPLLADPEMPKKYAEAEKTSNRPACAANIAAAGSWAR
jgi:2,4-dienoyl-CoA reductase-like NADH-dependent reductase (Old Yellow Enzyme family)